MRMFMATLALSAVLAVHVPHAAAMSSMMMPKCASGDPVVMMNVKTKMYHMMTAKEKMMMDSGTKMDAKSSMMAVCKSKAMMMHGKMSTSSSMMPGDGMKGSSQGGATPASPAPNASPTMHSN